MNMIKNIAVTIQYDGTRYKGWQKQGNTGDTIQGKLEHILFKMKRLICILYILACFICHS